MYISLHTIRGGHDPPLCHTFIYIDNYTDQSLTLLTTISCLLGAVQWITKMRINVFRQSRCLNTSDSVCDLFEWVCDRNDSCVPPEGTTVLSRYHNIDGTGGFAIVESESPTALLFLVQRNFSGSTFSFICIDIHA